jgi:hypothetical protein
MSHVEISTYAAIGLISGIFGIAFFFAILGNENGKQPKLITYLQSVLVQLVVGLDRNLETVIILSIVLSLLLAGFAIPVM